MRINMPWWLPFGGVPEIDAHELHAWLNSSPAPQIVDVRTIAEWRASRIAGAIHAPVTELKSMIPALGLDPGRPVVAICLSGHRSIPAVRLLRAHGYDARQLRQGMLAWWHARLPVEKGDG